MTPSPSGLRLFLAIDAIATTALALLCLALATPISRTLLISPNLLQVAGIFLLLFGGLLVWAASRQHPPVRLVRALVIGNALWVLDSVLLLFTPWLDPNPLGIALVLAQAAAVAVFCAAEYVMLRRLPRGPVAAAVTP